MISTIIAVLWDRCTSSDRCGSALDEHQEKMRKPLRRIDSPCPPVRNCRQCLNSYTSLYLTDTRYLVSAGSFGLECHGRYGIKELFVQSTESEIPPCGLWGRWSFNAAHSWRASKLDASLTKPPRGVYPRGTSRPLARGVCRRYVPPSRGSGCSTSSMRTGTFMGRP